MSRDEPLLQLQNITKTFPGVRALSDVSFEVRPGEIHGLLGENGAGKSTLMKVLDGVYQGDSGQIFWQGQPVTIHSPHDAQNLGISMIHQELALVSYLDAGKNIYLGREPQTIIPGVINWRKLYGDAQALVDDLNLDINVRRPVRFLSIAQQQMVEVAKALSLNAKLIIMDEPTSSLTSREVDILFGQMRALRDRGVSIVFISHRLEEIFAICDRVTVLRDGQWIATTDIEALTEEKLIQQMVGREVSQIYEPRTDAPSSEVILETVGLSRGDRVHDVSFSLRKGEILGIAGLVGAGRTELVETIFGAKPAQKGHIVLDGQEMHIKHPAQAIKAGIGFVTENRKEQGLFLILSVSTNIAVTTLRKLTQIGFIQRSRVRQLADDYIEKLDIRTPSSKQLVGNLSGGNQQKVIISRWLTIQPKILILDEPTRGIDVGAKSEIYRLMHRLAAEGVSIIMVSSELPEILGVSDRVLVMHEGRLAGEFDPSTATQDDLMAAATGTYQKAFQV